MQQLTQEKINELDNLIALESEAINTFFSYSELAGRVMLSNSIISFEKDYLEKTYGKVFPALSIEYRYFIIGILHSVEEKFKDIVISEVIKPTVPRVHSDELLKFVFKGDATQC